MGIGKGQCWAAVVIVLYITLFSACNSHENPNPGLDGDSEQAMDGDAMEIDDPDGDMTDGDVDTEAELTEEAPLCSDALIEDDQAIEETIVFLGDADGYPVFRIPSVVTTPAGTLVAFAEARPTLEDPGSGEIDLVMKRSTDCGRSWSELVVLADYGTGDAHNPAAVVAPDKTGKAIIWIFYNQRPASEGGEFDLPPGLGDDSASIWLRTSADEGLSWSEPRNLTAEVKHPDWAIASTGPGVGIVTRWGTDEAPAGRIVIPGWQTWGIEGKSNGSFVMLSDDAGESWRLGGLPDPGTNEAQIVELSDGRLLLDGRQNSNTDSATRFLYLSEDGGESWSEAGNGLEMTPVMSSILRYSAERDGDERDMLLHSGPSPDGRYDLRLWQSFDEAQSWENETIIKDGFVQYSVLTVLDDGSVGMVYETIETDNPLIPLSIRFVRFKLAYLSQSEDE